MATARSAHYVCATPRKRSTPGLHSHSVQISRETLFLKFTDATAPEKAAVTVSENTLSSSDESESADRHVALMVSQTETINE